MVRSAPLRVLVLLALAALACGGPERPHGIVLLVIDTLRADGLSAYGNPRPTTPNIDRLAEEGVLFEQAISHTSWTLPGFVGLLSGSYPTRRVFEHRLSRSLVEDLAAAGYATAAFTEGGYVSAHFGIDRGFGEFRELEGKVHLFGPDAPRKGPGGGGVAATFDAASAWLRANAARPFCLLVHTYEVHMPYLDRGLAEGLEPGGLPEVFNQRVLGAVRRGDVIVGDTERAYVRALYEGGVAATDHEVGRLLDLLAELGVADRTVVVLTADHGEELGERTPTRLGMHGDALYDTLLRVPLVVRDPLHERAVQRVSAQVRLVDVMPTILDLAGLPPPADVDGRSLVPLLRGAPDGDRPAYAEIPHPQSQLARRLAWRAQGWKLIVNVAPLAPGEAPSELYHLADDPLETNDLSAREPARKEALLERLRAQREAIDRAGRPVLGADSDAPPALRAQLRALGYAQ